MDKGKYLYEDIEECRRRFFDDLGRDGEWFGHLLETVRTINLRTKHKVTDVLIMENSTVRVANVKSYVPLYEFKHKPTREEIIHIARAFGRYDDMREEDRKIDDFSIHVAGLGAYRINFSKDSDGVGMTMRVLSFNVPKLEDIPYPDFYKKWFKSLMAKETIEIGGGDSRRKIDVGYVKEGGLIVHVGPTGSGKTTSMAAEINYLAEEGNGHIITYENPIEYRFGNETRAPVRQYEIGVNVKDFDEIVRHLTRNNPNVALVGEIREKHEIRAAVELASKGHLIFATLHANNAMEALTVLHTHFKDEPHMLASTLKAIVAHRLFSMEEAGFVPLYEFMMVDTPAIRSRLVSSSKDRNPLKEIQTEGYVNMSMREIMPFKGYVDYMTMRKKIPSNVSARIKALLNKEMHLSI